MRGGPWVRVTELARHWAEATALADMHKALDYSRLAGEEALAKLAPDEAVPWLNQALELLERSGSPDPAERCELTIELGEAQRQAGQDGLSGNAAAGRRAGQRNGDGDRMARAALANSRGFASVFGTVDEERLAALDLAISSDCEANPARCAELLALQAMELQFDPDHKRRRALADQALRLAREAGHSASCPTCCATTSMRHGRPTLSKRASGLPGDARPGRPPERPARAHLGTGPHDPGGSRIRDLHQALGVSGALLRSLRSWVSRGCAGTPPTTAPALFR